MDAKPDYVQNAEWSSEMDSAFLGFSEVELDILMILQR
jgi:hypothetical protein